MDRGQSEWFYSNTASTPSNGSVIAGRSVQTPFPVVCSGERRSNGLRLAAVQASRLSHRCAMAFSPQDICLVMSQKRGGGL